MQICVLGISILICILMHSIGDGALKPVAEKSLRTAACSHLLVTKLTPCIRLRCTRLHLESFVYLIVRHKCMLVVVSGTKPNPRSRSMRDVEIHPESPKREKNIDPKQTKSLEMDYTKYQIRQGVDANEKQMRKRLTNCLRVCVSPFLQNPYVCR